MERTAAGLVGDRRGFVLPATILALLVMSVLSIVALSTSGDERRSSRAMVVAAAAFYAAEAGLNRVPSLVSEAALSSLQPGDSLDLGWRDLDDGGSYRAVIQRVDEGGDVQTIYRLRVEGRGAGSIGGWVLTNAFTFTPYPTMAAAIKVRGRTLIEDESVVDGRDVAPGEWSDAGVCTGPTEDKPGLIIEDLNDLTASDPGVVLEGVPPTLEDPTINDGTFAEFGGPTRQDLIALADHVIGNPDDKLNPEIRPSYRSDGTCNTDDPFNWGSNDTSDPCFNYFPVIYVKDRGMRASLAGSYGQAFIIADAEFDVQATREDGSWTGEPGEFAGIILSIGCYETNLGQTIYGGILHDRVDAPGCRNDEKGLWISGDPWDPSKPSPEIHYSSCVIDRTLRKSKVGDYFGWHRLERSFEQVLF